MAVPPTASDRSTGGGSTPSRASAAAACQASTWPTSGGSAAGWVRHSTLEPTGTEAVQPAGPVAGPVASSVEPPPTSTTPRRSTSRCSSP